MTDRVPDAGQMEEMARRSLDALPDEFRVHLTDVIVRVEDHADAEMLESVGLDHPMELSGLYTGRPVGDKSVWDPSSLPDTIHLFRKPILAEARERGLSVERLVHHVLIHEIGHHFGFSDDDMHMIEDMQP